MFYQHEVCGHHEEFSSFLVHARLKPIQNFYQKCNSLMNYMNWVHLDSDLVQIENLYT